LVWLVLCDLGRWMRAVFQAAKVAILKNTLKRTPKQFKHQATRGFRQAVHCLPFTAPLTE